MKKKHLFWFLGFFVMVCILWLQPLKENKLLKTDFSAVSKSPDSVRQHDKLTALRIKEKKGDGSAVQHIELQTVPSREVVLKEIIGAKLPVIQDQSLIKEALPNGRQEAKKIPLNFPVQAPKSDHKVLLANRYIDPGLIWNEDSSSINLVPRLRMVKNNYMGLNKYIVNFTGRKHSRKLSRDELICELKRRVPVKTIQFGKEPFTTSDWQKSLPNKSLMEELGSFRTCAVVSSAASILRSKLGDEINGHDAVLRFNAAPINGFEDDVGTKTTFRIINSQVVATNDYQFHNKSLYKTGVLLTWDPAPYMANLSEWFKKPDYNFFEDYKKYRKNNPEQSFHILHPSIQWNLWNIMQENTAENIQPNPPSSGLMGIVLMMTLCKQTDVYEFLPSRRKTDRCHYYEMFHDQACTMGAYHPLMFEKNLVKRMNHGTDEEIRTNGKVTLPGFRTVLCPSK